MTSPIAALLTRATEALAVAEDTYQTCNYDIGAGEVDGRIINALRAALTAAREAERNAAQIEARLTAVEARMVEHCGAHDVQGQIEAHRAGGVDWGVVANRAQAEYWRAGSHTPTPLNWEAAARAAVAAYLAQTTQPHTPRTLPERVLAAGLGEPQPEAQVAPQAVTPAELGVDEIKVEAAGNATWQASWWPIGHDATMRWQHGGRFTAPELAFADAIECVRQSAHAAGAQREAAEARAQAAPRPGWCDYDDCYADVLPGLSFCLAHQAQHEANMREEAARDADDAERDAREPGARERERDTTGYYTEPDGYHYGP